MRQKNDKSETFNESNNDADVEAEETKGYKKNYQRIEVTQKDSKTIIYREQE